MSETPSDSALNDRIARNLERVRHDIHETTRAAGRNPAEVRLIAVSKTRPRAMVQAAIAAGQHDFGENTVQDARTKTPFFPAPPTQWHFIGHLQTNKAKYLPGQFQWLHTLDSLALAEKLSQQLAKQASTLSVLIQVNVTDDPAKHGVAAEALSPLLESLLEARLPALRLRGLMTIGRLDADETSLRHGFARLRELRDTCQARFGLTDFDQLSMGMSDDYREAIKEGATLVRVGSAIFGKRG